MGVAKEKMMSIAARGYGESNKYVCSGCVKDQYLQKVIRAKGQVGTCSFCKDENGKPIRHRKTYPLESLMSEIIPAIDYYYMSTDGNIPYDKETEEYLDLLILDEWGYVPVDKDGSQLLFRVISDSYESKSLILTTNLEFSKWGGIFTDDQMAAESRENPLLKKEISDAFLEKST